MKPEIKAAAKQSHEKFGKAYQMMADGWTKHTGTEMPAELAAAQLILCKVDDLKWRQVAASANWSHKNMEWQPMLTEDGLPYVSAEGLKPWAKYVAVDSVEDHMGYTVFQYSCKPEEYQKNGKWGGASELGARYMEAPSTHAIPGDPANSLAEVWRDE